MILQLPEVALVAHDTACHVLTRMALQDCLDRVEFGEIIVFTNRPHHFGSLGAKIIHVPLFKDKFECGRCVWYDTPRQMTSTTHALTIQWDSWVLRPDLWHSDFLKYDYIGAPWWYGDGLNVGNGGFALRSKPLMDFLVANPDRFPLPADANEDQILCRGYRRELEAEGFKWAPDALASRFSIERTTLGVNPNHFGFHGIFNWPTVLSGDALKHRMGIAKSNEYISRSGMLQTVQPEYLAL